MTMAELIKKICNDVYSLRDEVFWFEDAEGIEGDTELKKILDDCLTKIQALPR